MNVETLPQHEKLVELITGPMALEEIVMAVRKPAAPEFAGYYAPLAIQLLLDQLVAWELVVENDGVYEPASVGG